MSPVPTAAPSRAAERLERLIEVMARLRAPDGCPWDRAQDFASIAPYTIEEAYEVADAIARGDMDELCGELGDLLLQVVFHARMAEEAGRFDFADVADRIVGKLLVRHPHVFGGAGSRDAAAQTAAWESQKAAERAAAAAARGERPSALDGVAAALPALMRAEKLQKRAARVGFDWPAAGPVFAKVAEELEELRAAAPEQAAEEAGDLLFAAVNLARHLGVDPEAALRQANAKFERRFRDVEERLATLGKSPATSDLAEMDALWDAVKRVERAG